MLRFLALNTGARRDFVPFRQPPPPHPLFSLRSQTATSQLALRVSSLVRFYKSRFWFFSENFLKNFWIKFLKNLWIQRFSAASHSKMNENWLFCCCFQAVLLLFSNCLRCFSRIVTNFRNFSEIFQKFLKNFWKISEIFLKNLWIQRFSAASDSKMNEN